MNLQKALEIYKKDYHRLFLPKIYMLRENVGGTFNLTDQGCFIPSKEEWEVIKVIIEHFYSETTDEEIEKHNESLLFNPEVRLPNNEKKPKRKTGGYIYFLKADNGLVKIGRAKDLRQRLDHFTAKLPYKLKLVHSIKTDDSVGLEKVFHEKFHDKRKRGEWFELSDSDLQEVKAWE